MIARAWLWLVTLATLICLGATAGASVQGAITDEEVGHAAEIAKHIRDGLPPASAVIIGVGRSPVLPMALLQTWDSEYAFNLPLTRFGFRLNGRPPIGKIEPDPELYRPLSEPEVARLFAHLDVFLPSAEVTRGRTIVLFDKAETGGTVFALAEYLERYLIERGRTEPVGLAVMATKFYLPNIRAEARASGRTLYVARLEDGDRAFDQKLYYNGYKSLSEFGKFNLVPYGDPRPQLTARTESTAEYRALRADLARRHPTPNCHYLFR